MADDIDRRCSAVPEAYLDLEQIRLLLPVSCTSRIFHLPVPNRTESTARQHLATAMLCWSWGMYRLSNSSGLEEGLLCLASQIAPLASTKPFKVAVATIAPGSADAGRYGLPARRTAIRTRGGCSMAITARLTQVIEYGGRHLGIDTPRIVLLRRAGLGWPKCPLAFFRKQADRGSSQWPNQTCHPSPTRVFLSGARASKKET